MMYKGDFNFDVDGISNGICNCKDSAYIDHDIGHVLTGNLNILRDNKLRNLLQKDQLIGNRVILILRTT